MKKSRATRIAASAALGLALTAGALTLAPAAQAADASGIATASLPGTWVGTAEGFVGTKAVKGEVKVVFSAVHGHTATAQKYWRKAGASSWGTAQKVVVVVHQDNMITALDRDGGLFHGELDDATHMHGDMLEMGKPNKLIYFDLDKSNS